ncbi:hypothetical protein [Aliamphritea spongicola]|uniref:hypothetical protein n=1 Tax=Aliamphritea spongicola TaxID=707589 RepID=UPI00196B5292|nr:hypothetical protein [Aliamphritea spongicola]MBN3560836.1 hypothetical protein [Aliamphritea spongicola]
MDDLHDWKMDKEKEQAIAASMKEAREKARGYADFFGWAIDRDCEELGVVYSLNESLEMSGGLAFADIQSRGRGNDPPDCEAVVSGQRVAIEITELVSGDAIRAYKAGLTYKWARWSKTSFQAAVSELIARKNSRFPALQGAPYTGGYVLVIFTDEPLLDRNTVADYLQDFELRDSDNLTDIYFLISYDTELERCPFFKLK